MCGNDALVGIGRRRKRKSVRTNCHVSTNSQGKRYVVWMSPPRIAMAFVVREHKAVMLGLKVLSFANYGFRRLILCHNGARELAFALPTLLSPWKLQCPGQQSLLDQDPISCCHLSRDDLSAD